MLIKFVLLLVELCIGSQFQVHFGGGDHYNYINVFEKSIDIDIFFIDQVYIQNERARNFDLSIKR